MIEKNNIIELPIEKRIAGGYQKTFLMKANPFPDKESEKVLENAQEILIKEATRLYDNNYLLNGGYITVCRETTWGHGHRIGTSFQIPGGRYQIEIIAETPEKISQIEKMLFPEVEVKPNK